MIPAGLEVRTNPTGEALYATRPYEPGETVLSFPEVSWRSMRERCTVEHPDGRHLFHPVLAKTAHSCEPNTAVSFTAMALLAVRPIARGDVVSFDYATTETAFSVPFDCLCGASRCRGRIG